jgi:hypothetical protein
MDVNGAIRKKQCHYLIRAGLFRTALHYIILDDGN